MHSVSGAPVSETSPLHRNASSLLQQSISVSVTGKAAYTYLEAENRLFRSTASTEGLERAISEGSLARERVSTDSDWSELTLDLLGASILVRCQSARCAAGIARHFSAAVSDVTSYSPDFLIEVDWPEAGRHLFRARHPKSPLQLDGVRVMGRGESKPRPWQSHQPPLPPFSLPPLAGRFTALHSAALTYPDESTRAVLFLGERESGKTTCALQLCTNYGFGLLTDETTVLMNRSTMVLPFPREMSFRTGAPATPKRVSAATGTVPDVVQSPAIATDLVFLEGGGGAYATLGQIGPEAAMASALAHNQYFGSNMGESIRTLARLANECRSWTATHRDYAGLLEIIDEVAARLTHDRSAG